MTAEREKSEVVVITGASAGVGRATVRAFAREGAWIGLLARGSDGLDGARREVEEAGGKALVLPTDVSDADQVEQAAERVERDLGPIDVWVNDAMVSVFAPSWEITPAEYRRVTEVTCLGFVHGTLAALKRMRPRNRGVILQVGSALAYRGIPLQAAYCAAKHAIQGFNDSVRAELIHEKSKVRICMVQMPALNTPQFGWSRNKMPRRAQPVPPIFQPEVAAEALVYCAYHNRTEMWVGWPTVKAILANRVSRHLGDYEAAALGWESQMYDGGRPTAQPDNLYAALPGDHGAHGAFDDRAHSFSGQLWANVNRAWLVPLGLGVLLGVGLGLRKVGVRPCDT
jgi:NAD(P)-dependent dehydrogenase (short-subunit alcohol dehydrogenase family)